MARLLMITFAILLSGVSAGRADDRTPRPDRPGFWRSLTWFDETTSSTCIGRFDDPICTVETMLACRYRGKAELCSAATQKQYDSDDERTEEDWTRYRIIRAVRVARACQTQDHREIPVYNWKHGDLRIDIIREGCFRPNCQPLLPMSYFLRLEEKRRRIVGLGGPFN